MVTIYREGRATKWDGGGKLSFTPAKKGGGRKTLSHADRGGGGGGGTTGFEEVLTWENFYPVLRGKVLDLPFPIL